MKQNPMRQLEVPPTELLARVMGEVQAYRKPPQVGWLVTAQAAVLAALLLMNQQPLPTQLATTANDLRDWSASLAQATAEFNEKVDRLVDSVVEESNI